MAVISSLLKDPTMWTVTLLGFCVFVRTVDSAYVSSRDTGAASALSGTIPASSYSVQRWASFDLAQNLKKFIDHEEIRLRVISNFSGHEDEVPFIKQRLDEFKITHKELLKNATDDKFRKSLKENHPLTVLAAIRNFVAAWEHKFANGTIYGQLLREFLEANGNKPLPSRDDLRLAGTGLTIIQATYNLSKADLLKGRIMDHQGEPLNKADCYDIAHTSLKAGLLDTANEWLGTAIDGIDLEKVDSTSLTFNLSHALASLAKIAYKKKDQEKALKLLDKAVELDPDNPIVYQDYVQHRFGRDVDPIAELDREAVEPWRKKFFDMCQNSTNSNWLAEQKALQSSRLVCRFRTVKFAPFLRFKEEVLSKSPYISTILDLASDSEIRKLKNVTLEKLTNTALPVADTYTYWQYKAGVFRDKRDPVFEQIAQRLGSVLDLSISEIGRSIGRGDAVQVFDYGIGGLALPNAEFLRRQHPDYRKRGGAIKLATLQVYLSDVKMGGATVFIKQNITIMPRKGMAVLQYNYQFNGDVEPSLYTAICPLAVGENIVLEKDVWLLPGDVMAFCGRNRRSSHLTTSLSDIRYGSPFL